MLPNIQHSDGGLGLIRLFARHRTAPNLLMLAMVILGTFALNRLNTQFFPDIGIDMVSIAVEWPGASAEDVDSTIVEAIEPEVRFLDGVDKVRSSSSEGRASVTIEFLPGTDMQGALADVETAVGQVTTLPEDSETPVIKRVVRYDTISRLIVAGPFPEASLKSFAKRMRDDLLERGVDKVDLFGARDEEIHVEVPEGVLRRLDMSLSDVAGRVSQASQDLPSGDTRGGSERQIRSLGLMKTALEVRGVELRALPDGQKIRLADVADVSEAFDENDAEAFRGPDRAIELHVQRAVNADALKLADIVDRYLAEVRPTLPPGLSVTQYSIQSDLIRSRIELLLRNGASGLVLVLIVLFVFLNARVAFWVAAGIPISLLATLVVMLASGQSINMVSLFGLIMAIGIVVDDAIVVGEHAEALRRSGMAALEASEMGARRMAVPVFAASLTTVAAFTPLLVISHIMGQIISAIPFVAVSVILASLAECFLVLPGHLRHALKHGGDTAGRFRQAFDRAFGAFRDGPFTRLVRLCVAWRYATLAGALALLIVSFGLIAGGRIGFQFFAGPEADRIYVNIQMVPGTGRAQTAAVIEELQRSLAVTEDRVSQGRGGLVRDRLAKVGALSGRGEGHGKDEAGDNLGGLIVELVDADSRTVRTSAFVRAWKAELRPVPGIERMTMVPAQAGPPGRDVDIRLTGENLSALKAASEEVIALVARYPGVDSAEDDLPYGKEELILEVTPRGQALGFSTELVGRQVRNAFEGAIAKRFARGDEEVVVRVRLPAAETGQAALAGFHLKAPNGAEVPLDAVVARRDKEGFARIQREDGAREVSITAEIDKRVTSTGKVLEALRADGIQAIAARHGVSVRFAGKAEEQQRTFGDMLVGAGIGVSAIYIILAWVFASYTRPLVVMSIIPLGFVGATFGHLVMGYDLTILSLVALIGLSGIVVNDSIILVSTIDEYQASGDDPMEAIIDGTRDRLRAVILTSATTIGGLAPLIFETSLQAQFLIPMAVTMVFGLMATTLLVLVVVPCLLAVLLDLARARGAQPAAAVN